MVNVLEVLRNFIRYAPESVVAYLLASGLISGMDLIFSSHSLVIASDVGMTTAEGFAIDGEFL